MGAVSFIAQDITKLQELHLHHSWCPQGLWQAGDRQGWEQESHSWRHITALTHLLEKDLETAFIYFFIEIFNVYFLTDLV